MTSQKAFESISMGTNSYPDPRPGPWPWYVLLLVGHAICGFIPWLMLAWGLYQRGRKRMAVLSFFINFIVFVVSGWWMLTLKIPWWQLTVATYIFNFTWTVSAILYQQKVLGKAPRRYQLKGWKFWIRPIMIGIIIGFCIGTVYSIPPAFENRIAIQGTMETLDRQTVLWDFFQYSFYGAVVGLFLGLWWAGKGKHFRTSHVITFLSAFVLVSVIGYLFWHLIFFMIHEGTRGTSFQNGYSNWAVIPAWVSGFPKFLLQVKTLDILPLIVIPLLFGAAYRIRDFGKGVLLIPLLLVCYLPTSFTSSKWWENVQDQIVYDLTSPDTQTQATAYNRANILMKRYPNHHQWPQIAEKLARYNYQIGAFKTSRAFYQKIIDRYTNSNQWHWCVLRARAALGNSDFGTPAGGPKLEIPMVDSEEFLTHNWMAVLSVIRFWKGSQVPESEVIIKLKDVSKSDDEIKLNPLVSLSDLDDAVRNLGYEVLLIPTDLANAKALIEHGIPVIHPWYETFNVLYSTDETRSAVLAYSFKRLSNRLRELRRKEAKEILLIKGEGLGESQKRLARIANEAKIEYNTNSGQNAALRYAGPLMAIIYPDHKAGTIAKALNTPFRQLKAESDGYLATLIALAYLNHADPIYAVEWAKISAEKIADPFPLYVAHLANVWWRVRDKMIHSSLQLQNQFSDLEQILSFFNSPGNAEFLLLARNRFERDFDDGHLPWIIAHTYTQLLDRSDPGDLDRLKKAVRSKLFYNPASHEDWYFLADTCEWSNDISGLIAALKGAVSSNPLDSKTKLRLAFTYVTVNNYEEAETLLAEVDPSKIKYDADYPFCKGAVAEWKGETEIALKNYEVAIEMRRYKPIYYLRYGRLLKAEGLRSQAQLALNWAARIDADDSTTTEAVMLLSEMRKDQARKSQRGTGL